MLQVFQAAVRRQLWRSAASAAAEAPRRPPAAPRRPPPPPRTAARTCTVDPNQEEQFVFLDSTDREELHHHHQSEKDLLRQPSAAGEPEHHRRPVAGPSRRPPERRLLAFGGGALQEGKPDSLIQFHDVDFPLDESVVAAEKKRGRKREGGRGRHRVSGTPDVDQPISDVPCSGCGAALHCTAAAVPGYLPSQKYKALLREAGLGGATCQRCHLLTHHQQALSLQVSRDQYREVVRQIRPLRALVLLLVDLLDLPGSIVPDLPALVGANKHVVVLGNKVDLLPADAPNYLQRIKRRLAQHCQDAGFGAQVTDVHLISAKTGYGVEPLISSLQRSWKYRGDVYLVGSANAGKSTLFNTLLESDYCKSRASETVRKATISPWPGTTLNLLKFPIMNPTPERMFRRHERLQAAARQPDGELAPDERKRLQRFGRQGYLVGRVDRTFRSDGFKQDEILFDPDSLALGENEDGETERTPEGSCGELTHNELKAARWLFDTPGILKESDVLAVLSDQEVRLVVPSQAVVPRTFVLKPATSLFVGALFRIDFLQGRTSCWFSVVASSRVPVHVTSLQNADGVYEKHAGHALLGVPLGGAERMKTFPALVPQEFQLEGRGNQEAAADITLSSAGWVAVTAAEGEQLLLRVHGPAVAGVRLRTPPLLPHVVNLKGERIRKSSAYKPLKWAGPPRPQRPDRS